MHLDKSLKNMANFVVKRYRGIFLNV